MKTTSELANELKISVRYIQKLAKILNIPKVNNKYTFTSDDVAKIQNELANELEGVNTVTQEFTEAEYNRLQNIIKDYSVKAQEVDQLLKQLEYTKNQIEYFKKSLDKKDDQMNKLIDSFQGIIKTTSERNHLDYIDKTKDKS
jgi:seryl-tRNA synthetase